MEKQSNSNYINTNDITEEENAILEENKILKENTIDVLFILNNFGKCNGFISEIIQTEGITMYEHQKLREIMRVFNMKNIYII